MELFPSHPRPMTMTLSRTARGLYPAAIAVGLAALAGCGTYVANGATTGSASGTASAAGATTATGCASVHDATRVTAIRAMHLVEPIRAASLEVTDTNPTTVRALFRDFCQVISHKDTSNAVLHCPMEIGLSYGGTFYDGNRKLASYVYAASGCERVTVTSASPGAKPDSTVVAGTAAAAAPSLHDDMAKTLGLPVAQVFQPYTSQVNQGSGPSK
jgi:hypothetical protein